MIEIIKDVFIAVGLPMLRSVGGWAKYSLQDGVITPFEYRKLAETVLRTGIIATFVYTGAESYGFDADIIASSATAVIIDLVISSWKKK